MTVLVCIWCRDILILMKTPSDILDGAYAYIFVIFLGIPLMVLYNQTSAIMRSLGDSRSPALYEWLLNQKHLGPYIRNFRENRAIPLRH